VNLSVPFHSGGTLSAAHTSLILLDIVQTAVRGELFQPPIYLPYVLHYAVPAAAGIPVANERYQAFFA